VNNLYNTALYFTSRGLPF